MERNHEEFEGFVGHTVTVTPYSDDLLYVEGDDSNHEAHAPGIRTHQIEFQDGTEISASFGQGGWDLEVEELSEGCNVQRGKRRDMPEDDTITVDCDHDLGGFRVD